MVPEISGVALIPLIVGLVQAAKQAGLPPPFEPILSIVLGAFAGVALQYLDVTHPYLTGPLVVQGIIIGIGMGLAASGLFAGVKHFTTYDTPPAFPQTSAPLPPTMANPPTA